MTSDKILLDHGSGGKISHRLITEMVLPLFDNPLLARLDDGAVFEVEGLRLAFPPTPTPWIRSFSPAATSGSWPSTEPSTIWPCAVRCRSF